MLISHQKKENHEKYKGYVQLSRKIGYSQGRVQEGGGIKDLTKNKNYTFSIGNIKTNTNKKIRASSSKNPDL